MAPYFFVAQSHFSFSWRRHRGPFRWKCVSGSEYVSGTLQISWNVSFQINRVSAYYALNSGETVYFFLRRSWQSGPRLLPLTAQFIHCVKVSGRGVRVGKSSCSLLAKPWALWSGKREVSFCSSCTHRAHFIVVYQNALWASSWPSSVSTYGHLKHLQSTLSSQLNSQPSRLIFQSVLFLVEECEHYFLKKTGPSGPRSLLHTIHLPTNDIWKRNSC